MLSSMPVSPLINHLWLPHSPLSNTLHTNSPLHDQSKKISRKKQRIRWKSISIGIAHWDENKTSYLLLKYEKSVNPLIFIGWPYFPFWKEGNSPWPAFKSSLGTIYPLCSSLLERWSLRAYGRKPTRVPLLVPVCVCAWSLASATLGSWGLPTHFSWKGGIIPVSHNVLLHLMGFWDRVFHFYL